MAKDQLLNDNSARDFPFLEGSSSGWSIGVTESPLPFTAIVACGFTLGQRSGFIPGDSNVFLERILREHGRIWFYFTSDAPGIAGKHLVFSRDEDDSGYSTEYVDLINEDPQVNSISESFTEESDDPCGIPDLFSGFIITGPMAKLTAILADGDQVFGNSIVEPALLQSLVGSYGRSLNIANEDRTRYQPPAGCDAVDWPEEPVALRVRGSCLSGSIAFVPGYNSIITQNSFDNSITFQAGVGSGAGEPCAQIPLYDGEVPPADSLFLDGGPSCGEVARSISGIPGPIVQIRGGQGVTVSFNPGDNSVDINVDLHNMLSCGHENLTADIANDEFRHEVSGVVCVLPVPVVSGTGSAGVGILGSGTPSFPAITASGTGTSAENPLGAGVLGPAHITATGSATFTTVCTGSGELLMPPLETDSGGTETEQYTSDVTLLTAPVDLDGVGFFGDFEIYVGKGGEPAVLVGSPNNGLTNGEHSYFSSSGSVQVLARGGNGYTPSSGSQGSGGPITSPAMGDIKFRGGNGAACVGTTGGGGGGSGAPGGDGHDAVGASGGAARTDGGGGGQGSLSGNDPTNGTSPGGGPGAWVSPSHPGQTNGNTGKVRISYTLSGSPVTVNYTTPGPASFAKPNGVNTITVECWGGSGMAKTDTGGGGGGYSSSVINIATPIAGTGTASLRAPTIIGRGGLTTGSAFGTNQINGLAYGNGMYVAVGDRGNGAYSSDGLIWTPLVAGNSTGLKMGAGVGVIVYGVLFAAGKFLAYGSDGKASYSTDAVNWTALPNGPGLGVKFGVGQWINSIDYGNSTFVAVGSNGKSSYSSDGINWTATTPGTSTGIKFGVANGEASGVAFGGGKFVAVALSGGKGSYSFDGINWISLLPGISTGMQMGDDNGDKIFRVNYGGGRFVATGKAFDNLAGFYDVANYQGTTSLDGISWSHYPGWATHIQNTTPPFSPAFFDGDGTTTGMKITSNVRAIAYGGGTWVAGGENGEASYSLNGTTWTRLVPGTDSGIKFPTNQQIQNVVYANDRFFAMGNLGRLNYSYDGINWFKEQPV